MAINVRQICPLRYKSVSLARQQQQWRHRNKEGQRIILQEGVLQETLGVGLIKKRRLITKEDF